jgi:hypothetical protein
VGFEDKENEWITVAKTIIILMGRAGLKRGR